MQQQAETMRALKLSRTIESNVPLHNVRSVDIEQERVTFAQVCIF
jgi:hypothetical protein